MYQILGADRNVYGPVPREVVLQWLAENRVNGQTLVLAQGAAEWKPLASLPELSAWFAATPLPVGAPPPLPTLRLPRRTNDFALAGFILGIISLTLGFCCCYGFPFNVIGAVCSVIGLSQIRRAPELEQGTGLAIAGMVTSLLSLALSALALVFGLAMGLWDLRGGHFD